MSKSSIPVYTCERCGDRQELRRSHEVYSWGEFWAAEVNGPIWFGSQEHLKSALDLCPACMKSLKQWFDTPGRCKGTDAESQP